MAGQKLLWSTIIKYTRDTTRKSINALNISIHLNICTANRSWPIENGSLRATLTGEASSATELGQLGIPHSYQSCQSCFGGACCMFRINLAEVKLCCSWPSSRKTVLTIRLNSAQCCQVYGLQIKTPNVETRQPGTPCRQQTMYLGTTWCKVGGRCTNAPPPL